MRPASVPPLVTDTSVAVKWYFDEPHSTQALRVLDAIRDERYRLVAPDLIYAEFANAVWKRVVQDGLAPEDGAAVLASFVRLPLQVAASLPLLDTAYRLAVEHRCTVYDALFISASQRTGADLVTADQRLYESVHARLPRVRWLAEWSG